jgi:uncharacterized phage-associated protein
MLARYTDDQGRPLRQRELCGRHAAWLKANRPNVHDLRSDTDAWENRQTPSSGRPIGLVYFVIMAEMTALKLAKYIIRFAHDCGEPISNLKLQKLLYYCQAWYLARYGRPLFGERIEAWVHGPAVPPVYGSFKGWAWQPIGDDPGRVQLPSKEVRDHVDEILTKYGPLTPIHLEQLTHREEPWKAARVGLADDEPSSHVISHASMRDFYRRQLRRSR